VSELQLNDYRQRGILVPVAPLNSDEKVWSLYERDVMTPDGKHFYREQVIRVTRGERLVEFGIVLGAADRWTCGPFAVTSLNEDSVGQVREMADAIRADNGLDLAIQGHKDSGPSVIERAITQAEQTKEWMRRNAVTTRNRRLQKHDIKGERQVFAPGAPRDASTDGARESQKAVK
jgi:hypothetical protein